MAAVAIAALVACSDDPVEVDECQIDSDCPEHHECTPGNNCIEVRDDPNTTEPANENQSFNITEPNNSEPNDAGGLTDTAPEPEPEPDTGGESDTGESDTGSGSENNSEPQQESCEVPSTMDLHTAEQQYDFRQSRTCEPSGFNACQPGETPMPVEWQSNTVTYQLHSQGTSDLHTGEITQEVIDSSIEAFDAWSEQGSTGLELVYDGLTYEDQVGQMGGSNIVVWRDGSWPYPNYDAVALTTVTFDPSTGMIHSADIEMNSADYPYTNTDFQVSVDLRNVLAHEVGHFIGFDHSPHLDATMYATVEPTETKKRDLHESDIAGLCYVYPN